jgi:Lon protease-like protein
MLVPFPLFPLPLVLFPGQIKSLRIFEPRYRRMLHDCLNEAMPFGIILDDSKKTSTSRHPQHRVGVTAYIERVEQLDDGSYGIQITGGERFQIQTFHYEKSYLEADITAFPLEQTETERAYQLYQELSPKLSFYLQLLTEASGIQFDVYTIPPEPEELAYLTAVVLQINNEQKQTLLTKRSLPDMLKKELHFLASELNLLSWINQTLSFDRRRGFGVDRWLHVN